MACRSSACGKEGDGFATTDLQHFLFSLDSLTVLQHVVTASAAHEHTAIAVGEALGNAVRNAVDVHGGTDGAGAEVVLGADRQHSVGDRPKRSDVTRLAVIQGPLIDERDAFCTQQLSCLWRTLARLHLHNMPRTPAHAHTATSRRCGRLIIRSETAKSSKAKGSDAQHKVEDQSQEIGPIDKQG